MRVVIQRVRQASVTVAGTLLSEIGNGLLVLLGIGHEDDRSDIGYLVRKIAGCRIFDDHDGVMNLYEEFCRALSDALGKQVGTGRFGADMQVSLINDGPVTICIDSRNRE